MAIHREATSVAIDRVLAVIENLCRRLLPVNRATTFICETANGVSVDGCQESWRGRGLSGSRLLFFKAVFALSLLVYQPVCFSTPYYWISDGYIGGAYATPRLVCDAYIAWAKGYSDARGERLEEELFRAVPWDPVRPSLYEYQCVVVTYAPLADGSGWYFFGRGGPRIVRMGDGCAEGSVLNATTYICENSDVSQPTKQMGKLDNPVCGGDSVAAVDLAVIGNNYEVEVDAPLTGVSPLSFSRHYNSTTGLWNHTYSTHLAIDAGGTGATLVKASGKQSSFKISGSVINAEKDQLGTLARSGSDWIYTSPTNEIQKFNSDGKLVFIQRAGGKSQTLTYGAPANVTLVTVSDDFGNTLSFTQDGNFRPGEMHTAGLDVVYAYNGNGQFYRADRSRNGQTENRTYLYEVTGKPNLLTGIVDERGIRTSTWIYDEQNRVVSSQQGNGAGKTLIIYNLDGSSTVTNELGKQTTYRYQVIQGVKHITAIEGEPSTNCPSSNSTFTYNDRGQVLTKTDAKGFITTHVYNDRGLETSRTEATGTPQARTTTTTWHATFNLPLTVTEGGQVTTYTYDEQGRQVKSLKSSY